MQLSVLEQTTTAPIRKARRRSLGGRVDKPAPVSGPLECGRHYVLVVKSEELVGANTLIVQHASEVSSDAHEQKTSTVSNGARVSKKPRNKKRADSDDEDDDEEELHVVEEEEDDEEDEDDGKSGRVFFVWQLWANSEEGDEAARRIDASQQKRKKREKGSGASDDEGDAEKHAGAPKPLPVTDSKLQTLSHDSAKGEVRFELKLSSASFDESSPSGLTHLTFVASARKGQAPLPLSSPSAVASDGRQFDACLPLVVKAKPASVSDAVARVLSPRLPPIHLAGDSGDSPASTNQEPLSSVMAPTVLPSLRNSVPLPFPPLSIPTQPTVATASTAAGADSAPSGSRGRDDTGTWADFTSSVKAATLKSLQKGKEGEAKDQAEPTSSDVGAPASPNGSTRRSKRQSRGKEIVVELDDDDESAPREAAKSSAEGETSTRARETMATEATKERETLSSVWNIRQGTQQTQESASQQSPPGPAQEGLRKWYDEQNVRTRSSEILQFLTQAQKRIDPKFLERFTAVHAKLFPVFEQFAHPDTQHTLILILLHALTLTGYCVELIRFCYWVKEFSALTVDKVVEQATELSAELVQLQFQKDVEEKLCGCLTALLETLTTLAEIISGPVYESYQPEKEPTEKTGKGKKFISLAKGNAVPWIKEWLKSSYAEVQGQSVAKKMVYKDYLAYCNRVGIEPTTSSVLGKIFREVFPFVNTRRLGSRNNNITYYSNIGPTSNLLAFSTSSAQAVAASSAASSSSSAPSLPSQSTPSRNPSSPPAAAVSAAPAITPSGSRSRSTSLNSRNPSPPPAAQTNHSATGESASPASKPTFHMGSFRSYSPTSSFSYYPSASYYSSAPTSSSSSGARSSAASSSTPSGSSSSSTSLHRSTGAAPTPSSSFASAPIRPSSPTPTAAFLPQPTSHSNEQHVATGGSAPGYPGGYPPSAAHPAHYFTLPPIPNPAASSTASTQPSSSASAAAAQSSQAAAAAAAAAAAGYNPAMYLPAHAAALSAILTSFPHLLSYGLPAYPPPTAGALPPGYPPYPGYPTYPYPYPYAAAPPDQPQPMSAEAAAAAAAAAIADPALLAHLASNPSMAAFVKREQRDSEEQNVKEAEVQQHAMALDSARLRRREEREESATSSRSSSYGRKQQHHKSAARQQTDEESDSSESAEEQPRSSKRQRRSTKPRN